MPAETKIRVSATGTRGVGQEFDGLGRKVRNFGVAGQMVTQKMQRGFSALGNKLRGIGGMIALGGAVAGIKRVLDYSESLGQLQADIGLTTADAMKMDKRIRESAIGFKTTKESVLEAIQVYQDFGGIVPKGMQTLEQLTKMHKATGANMAELATIHATLIQTLNMSPKEGIKGMETFVAQTLEGQVNIRKLAQVIPGIASIGTGYGFTGMRGVQQMGTALQVAGQATGGNAGMAATQVKALMRDLVRREKRVKRLTGMSIFSDKEKKKLKDIDVIMAAILKKTGGGIGGKRGLGKLFTQYSMNLATAYGANFDYETGKFKTGKTVDRVRGVDPEGAGARVAEMYKNRTQGIAKGATDFKEASAKIDSALMEHGQKLVKWAAQDPTKAAGYAVAGYGAMKLLPHLVGGVVSQFGRRRGGGGGGGGGLGGMATGVQAVYVVNLPGANMWQAAGYGLGPGGKGGAGAGGKAGKFLGGADKVQAASMVTAAAAAGYGLGTLIDEYDTKHNKHRYNARTGKMEGGSDALATQAFEAMTKLGLVGKGAKMDTADMARKNALQRASSFLQMQARGVGLADKNGKRSEITDEVIMRKMNEAMGGKQSAEVLKLLLRIAKASEKRQAIKLTGDFFGLNTPTVESGRGPKP